MTHNEKRGAVHKKSRYELPTEADPRRNNLLLVLELTKATGARTLEYAEQKPLSCHCSVEC